MVMVGDINLAGDEYVVTNSYRVKRCDMAGVVYFNMTTYGECFFPSLPLAASIRQYCPVVKPTPIDIFPQPLIRVGCLMIRAGL